MEKGIINITLQQEPEMNTFYVYIFLFFLEIRITWVEIGTSLDSNYENGK